MPDPSRNRRTLAQLAKDLAGGKITSRALVETALERIDDKDGEGERAFLHVDRDGARARANHVDSLRKAGETLPPLAGIPVSIKDLFDIAGQVTRAGSTILADNEPARRDAPAVARLRAAGLIFIGRTNMTEFAYAGIGMNPHYDTPSSPWDRETGRIPGGSSSGAAVSVADGMACAALGTDTGGSCRIPAAFCGIVGYKPSAQTVPLDGAVPLSFSLDSVGPLAPTADDCARLHGILSAQRDAALPPVPVEGLRLFAPTNYVLESIDEKVAADFERALARLSDAGVRITEAPFPPFDEIAAVSSKGGLPAAEAYAWHRDRLESRGKEYDQRVRTRILRGKEQNAADYIRLVQWRRSYIERANATLSAFDAMVCPTVPVVAPPIETLKADEDLYGTTNLLVLRNPTSINLFDGCAISLPMHDAGTAGTGFMLAAPNGHDARLFAMAPAVEQLLRGA